MEGLGSGPDPARQAGPVRSEWAYI